MATFTPVNTLELKLRELLTDRNTPLWSFYTPLAAAPLWVIVRAHPELDGCDLVAPPGQNPEVCVFRGPKDSFIGLYTSHGRAQEAFDKMKCPPHEMTIVSAPGYQLLKWLSAGDEHLWINCGLPECQYGLDPDMIAILLERPEPEYEKETGPVVVLDSTAEAEKHLSALREFLSRQPTLRAAWIFRVRDNAAAYEIHLLMNDPEDKSLVHHVEVMVKALTPVEMEWTVAVMMGDNQSCRNLSKRKPPFYARADFLKP